MGGTGTGANGTGGSSGNITLQGANGGTATGTGNGGSGTSIALNAGSGGIASESGTNGPAGQINLTTAGGPINLNASGVGSSISLNAGFTPTTAVAGTTMANLLNYNSAVSTFSASGSIPSTASGGVLAIQQQAAPVTLTLPASAPGLRFTCLLTVAAVSSFSIQSAGGAGTMQGVVISTASVTSSAPGVSSMVNFVGGLAVTGDKFEIICADGTNWMAVGTSGAANGVSFS